MNDDDDDETKRNKTNFDNHKKSLCSVTDKGATKLAEKVSNMNQLTKIYIDMR